MNQSAFNTDPTLQLLRDRALGQDEVASNQLFVRIFTKHIFYESYWMHGTEIAAREQNARVRIDMTVQTIKSGIHALLFRVTGQDRKGKSTATNMAKVEREAYEICQEYLEIQERSSVWVIIYFGSWSRLWACQRNSESGRLSPFYPLEDEHGERDLYRDIQVFEADFVWAFEYMKAIENPDPSLFNRIRNEGTHFDEWQPSFVADHLVSSGEPDDVEEVVVIRVDEDRITCRRSDGSKIAVYCEWIAYNFKGRDGYLAVTSKGKFWTTGELKGKGKAK